MQTHPKKLLVIIAEAAIERLVARDARRLGAHGYTVSDARGKGSRGVRGASWAPSANVRIEVVCTAATAAAIADALRQRYYDDYAMILFVGDVEVMRPAKF